MCKYVLLEERLYAKDFGNETIVLENVHTECGYLLNKGRVEHQLSRGQNRCMFCGGEIEYVISEN